jgi:MFS family permease
MDPEQSKPFPFISLAALSIALISNAYTLTSLFPYVGFMILGFGDAKNRNEVGYYAGYVTGAFMAGRFVSSYYWGHWSDIHGRKPTLYISLISTLIFSILFGFSSSLWFAIVTRFCLGLFNGIVSTCKVSLSEICGKEHEVIGMGIVGGCWSIGYIIGPAIGGILADPCAQYPSIFGSVVLFQNFPYLLPNIAASLIAAIGLVAIWLYVPETMDHCTNSDLNTQITFRKDTSTYAPSDPVIFGEHSLEDNSCEQYEILSSSNTGKCGQNGRKVAQNPSIEDAEIKSLNLSLESDQTECDSWKSDSWDIQEIPSDICNQTQFDVNNGSDENAALLADSSKEGPCNCKLNGRQYNTNYSDRKEFKKSTSMLTNLKTILSIPSARNVLLLFMLFSLGTIMFDEVYPLWALATIDKGGLDWNPGTIGQVLSYAGIFMGIFQFCVYPFIAKSVGYIPMLKLSSVLLVPLYIAFPYCGLLQDYPTLLATAVALNIVLIKILAGIVYTSQSLITNHSVPASLRGGLNGFSMAVSSFGQAIGPLLGSLIFAYSVTENNGFFSLFDFHLVFYVCAIFASLVGLSAWTHFPDDLFTSKLPRKKNLGNYSS